MYSYNRSQQDALFLKFILANNSTCFGQTYCPSSGVLILYSQQLVFYYTTGWSKCLCAPDDNSTVQLMVLRWPSQNTFGMWTVLYWTRFSKTQFGVSINVWRLAGDTLNITCNFLCCNHQVHRDFLIILYLCWLSTSKVRSISTSLADSQHN